MGPVSATYSDLVGLYDDKRPGQIGTIELSQCVDEEPVQGLRRDLVWNPRHDYSRVGARREAEILAKSVSAVRITAFRACARVKTS